MKFKKCVILSVVTALLLMDFTKFPLVSAEDVYNISKEDGANICQWEYWGRKWAEVHSGAGERNRRRCQCRYGALSVIDAILLQKWLLAVPDAELTDWKAADLCEDNIINVFDLHLLKRMLLEQ